MKRILTFLAFVILIILSISVVSAEEDCSPFTIIVTGQETTSPPVGFDDAAELVEQAFGDNIGKNQPKKTKVTGKDMFDNIDNILKDLPISWCNNLYIYFNMHGSQGKLAPGGKDITVKEIETFLNRMRNKYSLCKITIVSDTCKAGSLEPLTSIPGVDVLAASDEEGCSVGNEFAKSIGEYVEELQKGKFKKNDADSIGREINERLKERGIDKTQKPKYLKSKIECNCDFDGWDGVIDELDKEITPFIPNIPGIENSIDRSEEFREEWCAKLKRWKKTLDELDERNKKNPDPELKRKIDELREKVKKFTDIIDCPEPVSIKIGGIQTDIKSIEQFVAAPEFSFSTVAIAMVLILISTLIIRKRTNPSQRQ